MSLLNSYPATATIPFNFNGIFFSCTKSTNLQRIDNLHCQHCVTALHVGNFRNFETQPRKRLKIKLRKQTTRDEFIKHFKSLTQPNKEFPDNLVSMVPGLIILWIVSPWASWKVWHGQTWNSKEIYQSKNVCPESANFEHFFDDLNTLKQEDADTCEGLLTLEECTNSLKQFMNNKTPGSDGFTIEFYRFFWNAIGPIMVDSFNYAFENGEMSISQKRGIISLIPKKDKDKTYLKKWRPISLLNNDYKIVTKALVLRLEKVLPTIISPNQTGYVKGRYIGESIKIKTDMMSFTKKKNIPGLAVFLDFEKAFDSIEWCYLQKCLEAFNFGPQLRQWITVLYNNISSCVLSNGFATKHFNLRRGVRQGCPLSGILFVIGVEILSNAIKRSKEIEGIQIVPNKSIKITQYADDTTVFVKDIRSVHRLFDLLQQFENCSGLRINQSKSEILWLGSLRQRKDSILKLKLSDETVYALGVYFSYDEELATKRNFFEKLPKLKKILNIWSSRDISIYGRVNIVKTLAISKLTLKFICSVLDTPKGFTDEVNNIL